MSVNTFSSFTTHFALKTTDDFTKIEEQLDECDKLNPSDRTYTVLENNSCLTCRMIFYPFPFTFKNFQTNGALITTKPPADSPFIQKIETLVQSHALCNFASVVAPANDPMFQMPLDLDYDTTKNPISKEPYRQNLDTVIEKLSDPNYDPNRDGDIIKKLLKQSLVGLEALMERLDLDPKVFSNL